MMKKNGFTLAEVLMSLAVVGVIAAVTLPGLHLNVEKQKVGPAFMKGVNTLGSAATFALRDNDVTRLTDIKAGTKLFDILEKYTKLAPSTQDESLYTSKDGIYFKYIETVDNKTGEVSDPYFLVKIDTNGLKKPDKTGVDVFYVAVFDDGRVAVPGTKYYKDRVKGYSTATGAPDSASNIFWSTGCKTIKFGDPEKAPTKPATCAGAIMQNGGKVLYGFSKL